jgi:hypothetical protein
MNHSLESRIKKLEDRTKIYPGHNYAESPVSTLKDEKRDNPYLLCGSLDEFLRMTSGRF